jgi:sulfate adenylyltransferase subunit 2
VAAALVVRAAERDRGSCRESEAAAIPDIVSELLAGRSSERQGRLLDNDQSASMERKKREGYF